MELEQRVAKIEKQVEEIRSDIESVLLEIRDNLPKKGTGAQAWEKRAWTWALLNLVIAVALFSNALYIPANFLPLAWRAWFEEWVHPFWISLAFVWLLLQMYPLALVLQQENKEWRKMAQRNLIGFLRAQPSLILLLTAIILVEALIKDIFPPATLLIALALLVAMASQGFRYLSDLLKGDRQS